MCTKGMCTSSFYNVYMSLSYCVYSINNIPAHLQSMTFVAYLRHSSGNQWSVSEMI